MVEILLQTMQSYINTNTDDSQDGRNKRNTQRSEVKITGNVILFLILHYKNVQLINIVYLQVYSAIHYNK